MERQLSLKSREDIIERHRRIVDEFWNLIEGVDWREIISRGIEGDLRELRKLGSLARALGEFARVLVSVCALERQIWGIKEDVSAEEFRVQIPLFGFDGDVEQREGEDGNPSVCAVGGE